MHGPLWETYPHTSVLSRLKAAVKQLCLPWKWQQVKKYQLSGTHLWMPLRIPPFALKPSPSETLHCFLLFTDQFPSFIYTFLSLLVTLTAESLTAYTSHNYTLDTKWSLNIQNFFLHTSTIHIHLRSTRCSSLIPFIFTIMWTKAFFITLAEEATQNKRGHFAKLK